MEQLNADRTSLRTDSRNDACGISYRISGHETFPFRYTWLPKAVRCLTRNSELFADEDQAMVELGVGKNMVRSIRFWSQAAGVTTSALRNGIALTPFGSVILGQRGLDPFLEDIRTLWLIHWRLSTVVQNPLLAWDFLLNRWQEPELVPSMVCKALHREAIKQDAKISAVTLEHHLDTFLRTYLPSRGRKREVLEDNLDCPLVELELLVKVGEREVDRSAGRREPIYAFRREEKPDITPELFAYCLNDFWAMQHPNEATLSFQEVAHGHGSPGQIFKLPEDDVRARVEALEDQTDGFLTYAESANLQQVHRKEKRDGVELLSAVYEVEVAHVR